MTNYELKINGKLVDVGRDFGVRLNRQILNPAELNTKDAQMSFSITLPPTDRNCATFNYANIEETRDKFNREYIAELNVNGLRVFPPPATVGFFRMNGVGSKGFKGNLYIPVPKTVKDVFGELKLNGNLPFKLPFADFAASVSAYNAAAAIEPQAAIFPFALYSVLTKYPLNKNGNSYSARELWDASVQLGLQDLPPSINSLIMIKHIFNSRGYSIDGSAFDDVKLTRIYQSYKNADSYVQPWNYGQHAKIHVRGRWSSRYNQRTGGEMLERGVNQGSDSTGVVYGCDFLDATNTKLEIVEDTGANVIYNEINDATGRTFVQGQIRIPTAGFYKVNFNSSIKVSDERNWRTTDAATGVQHMGGLTENADNSFGQNIYEVRLCRATGSADFGVLDPKLNGVFYYDNQPQNDIFDEANSPKYFPQKLVNGQTNFVDSAKDAAHLLGFNFGAAEPQFKNPRNASAINEQILVAKPSLSWDASRSTDKITRLAVQSTGWWKYGRIGNFDNEGENPTKIIDYSGGPKVTGKVLDNSGNPISSDNSILGVRVDAYCLSSLTGNLTPAANWVASDFIPTQVFSDIRLTATVQARAETAVTCFYDTNKQFIGAGTLAPTTGSTTYTNAFVNPPIQAAYVRFSAQITTLVITATSVSLDNIILNRFALQPWYSYTLVAPAGSNYEGFAYLFEGPTDTVPLSVTRFVGGIALVNTYEVADPRITIYLKTSAFNVDGTLVLTRFIQSGDDSAVIGYEGTNKYKIDLTNAPANSAVRGTFDGVAANASWNAQGAVNSVVWFDAGDLLTIASVSSEGRYRRDGMHSTFGWVQHEVSFDLNVQPFRTDADWLRVDLKGNGTAAMNWNDPSNFTTDNIDLVGFLSADMKTDDFVDNFCKAFNLRLSQTATNAFTLSVKQNKTSVSNLFVDLDNMASTDDSNNTPLGLPTAYNIGFTVDPDEEGFVVSKDDGGGVFETGALEGTIVTQKSTFSYNWFKRITKRETTGDIPLDIPIISKAEVWAATMPYPEAMAKRYTDLAYRFWYYDGLLNDTGAKFMFNGQDLKIAKVSNQIAGLSVLNYKNERYTILDNYFTILINGSSHYTEVEGYLTPSQYKALDGAIYAMFNRDLYFVAEVSAYDPQGSNKTKVKLIRKI